MASARRVGTNETINTYHSAGTGSPDYTSLATWETATDDNLVTGTISYGLKMLAGTHNDTLSLLGATTSSTYFRRVFGDNANHHGGVRAVGAIINRTTGGAGIMALHEQYASLQDFCITGSWSDTGNWYAVDHSEANQDSVGLVIYALSNSGSGQLRTFINRDPDNKIRNCIVENCEGNAAIGDLYNIQTTGTALLVQNCTFFGTGSVGLNCTTANKNNCHNVIVDGYTTCFSGTYTSSGSDYNLSSDSTAPGGNSVTTGNPLYVNEGGNDYHLSSSDTSGAKTGEDLSAQFDDDIDLNTVTTFWMGANSANYAPPTVTAPSQATICTANKAFCENGTPQTVGGATIGAGTASITSVVLAVTGGGIITVTTSGSVTASNNGTATVTLENGANAGEYQTVVNTAAVEGSGSTHGKLTITITVNDGTSSPNASYYLLCEARTLTITRRGTWAQYQSDFATTQGKLDDGSTSDDITCHFVDDDAQEDTQVVTLQVAATIAGLVIKRQRKWWNS